MALHLAILAAANRGHRPRHPNARLTRRLRPVRPSHKNELLYKYDLLRLVKHLRGLVAAELEEMRPHWPRPAEDGARKAATDSGSFEADRIVRKVAAKLGGMDEFAKRLAGIAAMRNRDSVDERLVAVIRKTIGVDVSNLLRSNGPLLQSMQKAAEANIELIKSVPTQFLFGLKDDDGKLVRHGLHDIITESWTNGDRWESMVEKVQVLGGVTEGRAKMLARDQTAKMNSAFNQERQQQVGIERYEWVTSEDERVRPEHAAMETLDVGFGPGVFRWDDPPLKDSSGGEPCHPGQDINCRCDAIPVVDMEALEIGTGYGAQQEENAA